MNVALYETHMFKPLKITSSLLNKQYASSALYNDFVNLLKSKLSTTCADEIDNEPELLQKYIEEIEVSLKLGEETTSLISSDNESFIIKKVEIENMLQAYSFQAVRLLNAILTEQNICRKTDIKRIDIFSSIFPNTFGNILRNKFIKIAEQKNIYIDQNNTSTITSVAKFVSLCY